MTRIFLICSLLFVSLFGGTRTLILAQKSQIPRGMVVDVEWPLAAVTNGKIYDLTMDPPREVLDVRNRLYFPGASGLTAIATTPNLPGIWTYGVNLVQDHPVAEILRWEDGFPTEVLTFTDILTNSHGTDFLDFGPDGFLYAGFGDSSDFYLPTSNHEEVQSVLSYRGKILRIDPKTGLGLPSNPFCQGDLDSVPCRIYALGFRNPWTMTIKGNDLYVGDVGDHSFEEVNKLIPGGNYGWPCLEADVPSEFSSGLDVCSIFPISSTVPPVLSYPHVEGHRDGIMGVGFLDSQMITADWSGEVLSGGEVLLSGEFPIIRLFQNGPDELIMSTFDGSSRTSSIWEIYWGLTYRFPEIFR